jgi:lipopolysaccharide biosynthesis glycosyltransferase
VLHDGLPDRAAGALADAAPRADVHLRELHDPRLGRLPLPTRISPYISEISFARLLVPELLPHLRRVLYLDADVLVLGDVAELWATPLDGAPLAAAVDPMVPTWDAERGIHNPGLVAGREKTPYFNSGVLLMDAAQWRERGVPAAAVAYGVRERDRIVLSDQEILNAVLGGDFHALDEAWNQSAIHLERLPSPAFEERLARTRILHFYGRLKPWDDHGPRRRVDACYLPYAPAGRASAGSS